MTSNDIIAFGIVPHLDICINTSFYVVLYHYVYPHPLYFDRIEAADDLAPWCQGISCNNSEKIHILPYHLLVLTVNIFLGILYIGYWFCDILLYVASVIVFNMTLVTQQKAIVCINDVDCEVKLYMFTYISDLGFYLCEWDWKIYLNTHTNRKFLHRRMFQTNLT